jgi:hypothetical protein
MSSDAMAEDRVNKDDAVNEGGVRGGRSGRGCGTYD